MMRWTSRYCVLNQVVVVNGGLAASSLVWIVLLFGVMKVVDTFINYQQSMFVIFVIVNSVQISTNLMKLSFLCLTQFA